MKTLIITVFLLLSTLSAFAQPETLWSHTYGTSRQDQGFSVQQTMDGGFIFAGYTYTTNPDNSLFNLMKIDANGTRLWNRTWNHSDIWDECYSVQQTPDSGYVLAGSTYSFTRNWDFWLVKTNANGDSLWSKTFGGTNTDECRALDVTADSGLVIVGYTNSVGDGHQNFWLIKTNANGDTLWTRTYNGAFLSQCNAVQQTSDGGYALAGYTTYGDGNTDFYLVKTDGNGDSLWTRTFGGARQDICHSVEQTTDGGYILAGTTSPANGDIDVWLVKTDANGGYLWSHEYGGNSYDECLSVHQTVDGGYILAGWTQSFGHGNTDWWVIKTDTNGDSLWTQTYGSTGYENCRSSQQTSDGGYVFAGSTGSFGAGSVDFWLIKTEPDLIVPHPDISVTPALLNFGDVFVEDSVSLPIQILSTGNSDLTVSEILVPADFHTNFVSPQIIRPEISLIVQITFAPSQVRDFNDSLFVVSDAPNSSVAVRLMGAGIANAADPLMPHPSSFILSAYPNPFNPATTIEYTLSKSEKVSLKIFNLLGQEIKTLVKENQSAGIHNIEFDGSDLPSGVYLYRIESPSFSDTKKMLLLK